MSELVMIVSFAVVLVAIVAVGLASARRKKKTTEDYFVAGRSIAPSLTALSAVGTNNSGFMFIGMIGYTYRLGIESIWMMLGFIIGDYLCWRFVYARLRRESEREGAKNLATLLGTRGGKVMRPVVVAGALVTLLFLGTHAAGQIKAGSTALHALFGWDMWVGAVIGAIIVILYSYAGGIRADIWTDAAQSAVMFVAMLMLVVVGVMEVGGPSALVSELEAQDPALLSWFPADLEFGLLAYLTGFFFAGVCALGQPHLTTRFMSLESEEMMPRARRYYFAWYVPFSALAIAVGLYCRAYLPDLSALPVASGLDEPTELALPILAMELLPSVFVGAALAGIFAATVSTADSQIIVCSSAVTQDLVPGWKESYLASKIATFVVTAFSLAVALGAPEGVFGLILIAWSAMGVGLGGVLLMRLFQRQHSAVSALAVMAVGTATVVGWHLSGYDDDVFKAFPAALAAGLVFGVIELIRRWRRREE